MSVTAKRYAGLAVSDNSNGDNAWDRPGSAGTPDGATCTLGAGDVSHRLISSQFGFDIPFGSVIRGIKYGMETSSTGLSLIRETNLQSLKENQLVGSLMDFGLVSWLLSFLEKTVGGATDLHDTTWSSNDINSSGFGVMVQCENVGILQATATVNHAKKVFLEG
jgi:hypothetical protein